MLRRSEASSSLTPGRRERNRIERLITRLKQHRAIATRDEKLRAAHAALITIASLRRWL